MLAYHFAPNRVRNGRTIFLLIVLAVLLLSGCGAEKPKVYRIGVLSGLEFFTKITDGFKEGMTALDYVEGKNVTYDVQNVATVDPDAYKRILQKFVADKVDLILVFPTEAALEAKAAAEGANIPVLFANVGIENNNLVNSVREPGGNITGVRYPAPDLGVKRYQILLELAPQAKRICVPYQDLPHIKGQLKPLYDAKDAGITLVEAPVNSVAELEAFFAEQEAADDIGCDAVLMIPEPLMTAPDAFTVAAKFAYKHKLPIGGATMVVGEYASIFGLTPDNFAVGKEAAPLADKILKGTPAGTIPIVSPESFLQINYKAAQELGLTVPESLLRQADEIIR